MLLKRIDATHIEYKGVIWTRYPDSSRRTLRAYYYHHFGWKDTPRALHREIYSDFVGKIPKGFHVHHIDGNTENNSPSNLQALPPEEHARVTWEENPQIVEKRLESKRSKEGRMRNSVAQKNRKKTKHTCLLCGETFESRCNSTNAKWCPDCSSHQTTNKGHRYFPKKWQMERFGEIKIDPGTSLTMIK